MTLVQNLIYESVGPSNVDYRKVKELLNQFLTTGKGELLIRIYTVETPFYGKVTTDKALSAAFASVIRNSADLSNKAFSGICFRGLSMTVNNLQEYQWAMQKKNRYLEINTFCSCTLDLELAMGFADARTCDRRVPVLMHFQFTNRCRSAILLGTLSDFEDEQEVLIFPGIIFSVSDIQQTETSTTIYLVYRNCDEEFI